MKSYLPKVPSSNVFAISHSNIERPEDSTEGNLIVSMKGGTYVYEGVPIEKMIELLQADSAGKFLNSEIKPNYGYHLAPFDVANALAKSEPVAFDETEYLLLSPSNREQLKRSVEQAGEVDLVNLIHPAHNNWLGVVDLKFLDPNVKVQYAKPGDAAFDLMASSVKHPVSDVPGTFPVGIMPGDHILIGTGIAMHLGHGLAGLVTPRSGLAKKLRVSVVNTPGLIDGKYTGEIGVLVENRGEDTFFIKQYDRIAQFLIVPAITPIFRVVDDLDQTERGASGFGSTGVASEGKVVV